MVNEYLEKMKNEEMRIKEKRKAAYLESIGLVGKEYTNSSEWSNEYPFYDDEQEKYYREIPLQISDQQFEEIKKYEQICEIEEDSNGVASVLSGIAWLTYISGFILGIFFGSELGIEGEFAWSEAAFWWTVAFVSGSMTLGFAEIIKLLHKINSKLK